MHWLFYTFGGFMLCWFVMVGGVFGGLIWFATPSKADQARWAAEKQAKQDAENREREPKRLL